MKLRLKKIVFSSDPPEYLNSLFAPMLFGVVQKEFQELKRTFNSIGEWEQTIKSVSFLELWDRDNIKAVKKTIIPARLRVLSNCFVISIARQMGQPSPIHL
jgi:hypothetical protein